MSDFRDIEMLAEGNFGRVFLVQHKQTEDFYAIKSLRKAHLIKTRQVEHVVYEKW